MHYNLIVSIYITVPHDQARRSSQLRDLKTSFSTIHETKQTLFLKIPESFKNRFFSKSFTNDFVSRGRALERAVFRRKFCEKTNQNIINRPMFREFLNFYRSKKCQNVTQ